MRSSPESYVAEAANTGSIVGGEGAVSENDKVVPGASVQEFSNTADAELIIGREYPESPTPRRFAR